MKKFKDDFTIGDVLSLFKYTIQKFVIIKLYDNGNEQQVLGPIQYDDVKFKDIKEIVDEKVYSLRITGGEDEDETEQYIGITYCDPYGDWK